MIKFASLELWKVSWEEEEGQEEGRPVRNNISGPELRWWAWKWRVSERTESKDENVKREWTEPDGRRDGAGREWLMFLLQNTGWLAMLSTESKEKQVQMLEEPEDELWWGHTESAAPKGHFHKIEALEKDVWSGIIPPPNCLSIWKPIATSSPRHPTAFPVLHVSPAFLRPLTSSLLHIYSWPVQGSFYYPLHKAVISVSDSWPLGRD